MCHQTVSLAARHLEANGIPTVIVGSARDIVEYCGVPRFLFVDFPLGNPCGAPYETAMQAAIARLAVSLLAGADSPRTTRRAPFDWPGPAGWRETYGRVRPEDAERLAALGAERRRMKLRQRQPSIP